jgi:hypothetical protein
LFALCLICGSARAQFLPVFSGGGGTTGGVTGGSPNIQPIIVPVVAAPLGPHLLIEARGFVQGLYQQTGRTGPYNGTLFTGLTYLQADYIVNSKLTIVGGRYLTPFGTYNERLTAPWIPVFPDPPAIFVIGTRSSGSSNGGMARGALFAGPKAQFNYVIYYSTVDSGPKFKSGRTAGYRFEFYFPTHRLEIGTSYNRYQGTHSNNTGVHLWWQPYRVPFNFRSEYARTSNSFGYWFESTYRLSQWRGPDSLIGRLEPAFRMQETFRIRPNLLGASDSMPGVGTQEAQFGFVYHLPKEFRLNGSYGRAFASTGNHNVWELSMTYRYLFPAWPGGKK